MNVMADAALGGMFGTVHHLFAPELDAARVIKDQVQVEQSAPGLPVDVASNEALVSNMTARADALLRGDDTANSADVRTIPDPVREADRDELSSQTTSAGREETGKPVVMPTADEAPSPVAAKATEPTQPLAQEIKTPMQALYELSRNLSRLTDNPSDEVAHANVRSISEAIESQGFDAASIEGKAVARAGEGSADVLANAKANEKPLIDAGELTPETRESLDAAQQHLAKLGDDVKVPNAAGELVPARDALKQAAENVRNGKSDGDLVQAAAACAGRG